MSSGHALYLCQVSCNNLKRYQSIRVDKIPIGKITKGDNSAKNADGATVVNLRTLSVMLYISTKFCEIILKVSKLSSGHDFYTENYKGE